MIILNPGLGCSGATRGNRRPQLAYNMHHVSRHLCLQILSPTSRNASTDPLDEVLKFRREGHLPAAKAQGSNSLGKKVRLGQDSSLRDLSSDQCLQNSELKGQKLFINSERRNANLHKGISLDSAAPNFEEMAYELALFNTFPTVYHTPWFGYIYIVVFPAQRYIGYRLRLLYEKKR